MKFEDFKGAIGAQPLVPGLKTFLINTPPAVANTGTHIIDHLEIQKDKIYASLFLSLIFTGYIILIKFNYYGSIPCSCAGVLGYLD